MEALIQCRQREEKRALDMSQFFAGSFSAMLRTLAMTMREFDCVVIDNDTNATLAEYKIQALDWFNARNIVVARYREERDLGAVPESKNWRIENRMPVVPM